ncbi:MAG: protein kinase [Verrucomicrobiales bacterium]|nr:protein kinase [Verrucomicrobiales bacterium]
MKAPVEQGKEAPPTAGEADTRPLDSGEGTAALARILDDYLAELEAGRAPDRAQVLAAHPHLAAELEPALAGLEFIQQTAGRGADTPSQLGDFRIVREVGRGGMGVVYEAEQVSLKRRVALKVLRFGAVADEVAMARFQREAETVARLHHTNIVPIFAVGSANGVRYYAMQFIEGRDLADRVKAARAAGEVLPSRAIADWGLQAAEALAHAHQRGVIHRDIKPSNLICDQEGRIWLTDFGLARRMEDAALSVVGALLGTPRYMSPEQARAAARPVDHRTDLYSLGATLYELATRRPIFEAATAHEVIAQILHSEPRRPRELAPELPRDLETIILKCLAKEPADRYPTAQALAEDLRAFLAGRPLLTRPPRFPEQLARWVRKHRRAATHAAVSASVAVALVVGGWLGWQQHRRARQGYLALSAAGPNVLGEVLDVAGQAVTPVFPVPTAQPVALPAGTYQVRLSAAGMLSETWPVDIQARQTEAHNLPLRSRWLWPPKEVNPAEYPESELVNRNGAADLLVLTHVEVAAGTTRGKRRLQLLRGATGEPVWERPLQFDETTLPAGGAPEEWTHLLSWGIASSFRDTGLDERTHDLDGDGTPDFVLLSRNSPSLLAVSGRTGTVLWWARARPTLPPELALRADRLERSGRGFVVGRPAVAEVDGDGVPDFIACFRSAGDGYVTPDGERLETGGQSWIGAISGKTGASLWQQPVDGRWEQYVSSSRELEKFDPLCVPAVGRVGGRAIVVLVEGSRLRGWETTGGATAWPPLELGFVPTQAPTLADLEGDGDSEALWLRREEGKLVTVELLAVDLPGGAVRWTRPLLTGPGHQARDLAQRQREVVSLLDVDHDGRPEIAAITLRQVREGVQVLGVELLEGATGQPRWERRLGAHRQFSVPEGLARQVVGPDLDGDGHRELFAVWPAYDTATAKHGLQVAALSGRTGALLWRSHQAGAGGMRFLGWWQAGTDGWPLLLLGVDRAAGGQAMTYVLSSGTGRLEHVLPDVREPQVADFNGDGIPDLYYTVSPQGAPRQLVVKGAPPEPWRRPGKWELAQDFDGDGHTDLVGTKGRPMSARSGRDGRLLWQAALDLSEDEPALLPRSPGDDLDGDGVTDVILQVRGWRTLGPSARESYRTLAACSGKDGRRLWLAEGWEPGNSSGTGSGIGFSYEYPLFAWGAPGDADGPAVLAVDDGSDGCRLSRIDGRSGRLAWSTPILRGGFAPSPATGSSPWGDFNGDGIADLALWSPEPGEGGGRGGYRLKALEGRTGEVLWASPSLVVADETQVIWPEAVVGDLDGDGGPEVVVAIHQGYHREQRGYPCELVVADGRTGQVRWTWGWRSGFPDIWPPVVLRDGEAKAWVCLAVREEGFDGLAMLDASGRVRLRRPLQLERHSLDVGRQVWRALSGDADRAVELAYYDGGHVCLAGGEGLAVRWRWPVSGESIGVVGVVPGRGGEPATLAVWSGREVLGLGWVDGRPRWRSQVASELGRGRSPAQALRLAAGKDWDGLPRVQLVGSHRWGGSSATLVGQAWSTTGTGRYVAPRPPPQRFPAMEEHAWPQRPWPWAERLFDTVVFLSGATSLLLLALPVGLAVWAARRRSGLAGGLLLVYAAVAGGWFHQGVSGLVAIGFAVWLGVRAWRTGLGWLAMLAPVYAALALLPIALASANHPIGEVHPWGRWWWLDEWTGEPLVIAITGLPPLLFWVRSVTALRRQQWRVLGRWLGGAVLAALLMGAAILWLDNARRFPEETYAWQGWYGIGFGGVYVAGCFGLLELAWQRMGRWWQGRRPGPPLSSRTAATEERT